MKAIRYFFAMIMIVSAAATFAQTTFVLERIDVPSSSRIPAAIIRSETRLKVGASYRTEQFDQAVFRLRRLPFVAYAAYTLEPGTTPSSRVLRLNLIDEYHLNYAVDVAAENGAGPTGGGGSVSGEGDVGYRLFTRSTGVLDLTAGSLGSSAQGQRVNSSAINARYSLYNLFGTRAYASAQVTKDVFTGNSETTTSPVLLVGLPLTQIQTIRAMYSRTSSTDRTRLEGLADPAVGSDRQSTVEVDWLYETTDDPYFSRRGWLVAIGPQWQRETPVSWSATGFPHPVVHYESATLNERSLNLAASVYWPLWEHASVWGRATASQMHITGTTPVGAYPTTDNNAEEIILGYAHNFDSDLGSAFMGRNRFEAGVGYQGSRSRNPFRTQTRTGTAVNIGYAHRGSVGVVHLTFTYLSN